MFGKRIATQSPDDSRETWYHYEKGRRRKTREGVLSKTKAGSLTDGARETLTVFCMWRGARCG